MLGRSDRGKAGIGATPWRLLSLLRAARMYSGDSRTQAVPTSDVSPRASRVTPADDSVTRGSLADAAVVLGAALLAAWWCWHYAAGAVSGWRGDFDQLHAGARAILAGRSPYAEVGPGRAFDWPWPLLYPGPAVALALPLAWLDAVVARSIFAGVSGGVLAAAILWSGHRWRLMAFISQGAVSAFAMGQWSPLMLAIALWPALGWLAMVKPNLGVAMLAGARPRDVRLWSVVAALVLLNVSTVLYPRWPLEWWEVVRNGFGHGTAPLTRPWGWLLLAAVVRWRRADARILLALAVVPQTPALYDGLLFFAFARSRVECVLVSVLTFASHHVWHMAGPYPGGFNANSAAYGAVQVWALFLPALVMVLRRPNRADPT
jgi:hypothetical protein